MQSIGCHRHGTISLLRAWVGCWRGRRPPALNDNGDARRPLRFVLIPTEVTRWAYTGVTSPPRRCFRSPAFDGFAGTESIRTRSTQQASLGSTAQVCLPVALIPVQLFGWTARPTSTRPPPFAYEHTSPLCCPLLVRMPGCALCSRHAHMLYVFCRCHTRPRPHMPI